MQPKVTIKRQKNLIEVHPAGPVLPFVRNAFAFRRLVEKTDGWGRRIGQAYGELEFLYREESDDRVVIAAGLMHRLIDQLKRDKIEYEYFDLRSKTWPEPEFKNIFEHGIQLRDGQADLLAKLATCDMGRIDNPTGDGKTFLITMMALVFPESSILVVTDGLSAFGDLYDRLMEVTPDVGRVGGGRCDIQRITLCNKDSLHRVPADEYDFCFVDECHVMAAPKTAPKFSAVTNARIFGFSATQRGRHDQADILLEAMFGPVIHEVPYQLSVSRGNVSQIEVTMYECHCTQPINLETCASATARVRKGYWRNDERNRLVAYVARELVPADDQQLIVVDTIEHAFRIQQFLPGWTVVYAPKGKDDMLKFVNRGFLTEDEILKRNDVERIRREFREGEIKRAIANSVWHKAMDFPKLEYLIRADGGRGIIGSAQISGRLSRLYGDNLKHLIDFMDVFDRIALSRSQARRRSYKSKGWKVVEQRVAMPAEWVSA